jgi:hypothetical protein
MIQQDFDKKCADYDDLEKEAGSRIKEAEEQTPTQIKVELQPLNESAIARSTKRKTCDEEHQEEEKDQDEESSGAVSQSQSSKRSRIGNADDTGSVASGRNQTYDDDLEMIAKELLHEKDMYTKLMNRYLHARRELQRRG